MKKDNRIEHTDTFQPQFHPSLNADGTRAPNLLTVALQDADTAMMLYVAFMDKTALQKTVHTGRVHLYSRSAKKVRQKGADSGDELEVVAIAVNCNQDSLLVRVNRLGADGGVCHAKRADGTAYPTCYYRVLETTDGMILRWRT